MNNNFGAFHSSYIPNVEDLSELIEQQNSSTNTRLEDDAFLLKSTPFSQIVLRLLKCSFTYGVPYEWIKLDERVRRLINFNMFNSDIKTVLFLRYFDI